MPVQIDEISGVVEPSSSRSESSGGPAAAGRAEPAAPITRRQLDRLAEREERLRAD